MCRYPILFSIIICFCAFFGGIFWGFGWIDWRIWGHAWCIFRMYCGICLEIRFFLKVLIKLPETSSKILKSSIKRLQWTPNTPKSTKITQTSIIPRHFPFLFQFSYYVSCLLNLTYIFHAHMDAITLYHEIQGPLFVLHVSYQIILLCLLFVIKYHTLCTGCWHNKQNKKIRSK